GPFESWPRCTGIPTSFRAPVTRRVLSETASGSTPGGSELGHPLEQMPPAPDVLFRLGEQLLCFGRVDPGQHSEAALLGEELLERNGGLPAVEDEGRLAFLRPPRIEAIQRPEPRLGGLLLLGHLGAHLDAVGDAGAVG